MYTHNHTLRSLGPRHAALVAAIAAASLLGGCVTTGMVGPNTLVVPVTQTAMTLAGHATGAAMDKVLPKKEREEIDPTDLQAKADALCVEKSLTDEQCAGVKRNYAKAADFIMTVQGVEEVAEAERDRQRAEAFKPQNIAREVVGGAVGQTLMLGNATVAGELNTAIRP
jgi:hypothetical protein